MAATTGAVYSWDCKAYYNSGTYASPTWNLLSNMGEVSPTDEFQDVDIPLRVNGGFSAGVPGFRNIAFAWKMLFKLDDTAQAGLRTKARARTPTEFAFLDQAVATVGAVGIRGTFYMKKFNRAEEDGKPCMVEVEIKPDARAAQPPEDYVAS